MITTNIDKKALVEKLLKGSMVTIDEAFMLLDESAPIQMPYIIPQPVYPQYPYQPTNWPWDWFHMPVICSYTSDGPLAFTDTINSSFQSTSVLTLN